MIKVVSKLFLSVMLLLVIICLVNAQWMQTNGPGGGAANAFVVHNNIVFAGTATGIYQSDNNGDSWKRIDMNHTDIVYTLMVYRNTIFAGTGNGVYFSSDVGLNWHKVSPELDSSRVISLLAFDTLVLAGTFGKGVVSFTREGTSWIVGKYGDIYDDILSLAVYDTVVLAGTTQSGIFISSVTDSGKINWDRVDSGLPAFTSFNCFFNLSGRKISTLKCEGQKKTSFYSTGTLGTFHPVAIG